MSPYVYETSFIGDIDEGDFTYYYYNQNGFNSYDVYSRCPNGHEIYSYYGVNKIHRTAKATSLYIGLSLLPAGTLYWAWSADWR